MKRRFVSAVVVLAGCVVMVFAAKQEEDPCTKKHTECTNICENEFRNCRARQTPVDQCEQRKKICVTKCDNDKVDCQNKSGGGKGASPTATPGKKK